MASLSHSKLAVLSACVLLPLFGALSAHTAAAYTGNLVFTDSNSTSVSGTPDPTSLAISPSSLTANLGAASTFTITVTDTSSSPTTPGGTVQVGDNGAGGTFSPASCSLSSGTCTVSYSMSASPPSSITITASYSGDSTHNASTGTASLTVGQLHNTSTAVTPSSAAMANGGTQAFTAQVTDTSSSPSAALGTVSWSDNGAGGTFNPASCTPVSGSCATSYTAPASSQSSITITASYGGDSSQGSSSGTSALTITLLNPTSTTISPSSAPLPSNDTLKFTVQVADTSSTPTAPSGTITFNDGNNGGTFSPASCTLPTQPCVTTYTSPANPLNIITVNATYSGDGTHSASYAVSTITTVQSNTTGTSNATGAPDATVTSVTANPATFTPGSQATVTASVTDTANPSSPLNGIMSWSDGGAGGIFAPNNCLLVSNHCAITYTSPSGSADKVTITATYPGDSAHSGSSGTALLSSSAAAAPISPSTSTPQSQPPASQSTPGTTSTSPQSQQPSAPPASPSTPSTSPPSQPTPSRPTPGTTTPSTTSTSPQSPQPSAPPASHSTLSTSTPSQQPSSAPPQTQSNAAPQAAPTAASTVHQVVTAPESIFDKLFAMIEGLFKKI